MKRVSLVSRRQLRVLPGGGNQGAAFPLPLQSHRRAGSSLTEGRTREGSPLPPQRPLSRPHGSSPRAPEAPEETAVADVIGGHHHAMCSRMSVVGYGGSNPHLDNLLRLQRSRVPEQQPSCKAAVPSLLPSLLLPLLLLLMLLLLLLLLLLRFEVPRLGRLGCPAARVSSGGGDQRGPSEQGRRR